MTNAPDWSEEEFRLLLSQPNTPAAQLQAELPQRSIDAIELVRNGIAHHKRRGESPLLSKMMVGILEERDTEKKEERMRILRDFMHEVRECAEEHANQPMILRISAVALLDWRKLQPSDWKDDDWPYDDQNLTSADRSDEQFLAALKQQLRRVGIVDIERVREPYMAVDSAEQANPDQNDCVCCQHGTPVDGPRICPLCGHQFQGNGWDGIDAHWRSRHRDVMSYEAFWQSLCPDHRG
jgi:hypothetical protein